MPRSSTSINGYSGLKSNTNGDRLLKKIHVGVKRLSDQQEFRLG